MLKVKKISVIALILFLIGVVGTIFTIKSVSGSDVKTEEIKISDEKFTNIDIKTNNASVEILPTNEKTALIEFTGNRKKGQKYDLSAEVEGDVLTIEVRDQKFMFFSFDFAFSSPELTVYLPEKLYDSIQIESDNGRTQASGVEVKKLHASTNNGRIDLKDIKSASVTTEADNGAIQLENVEGELSGRTSNGQIELITDYLDRPIEFKTANGRIEIQTDKEPTNAIFDVHVDNGNATIFGNSNWNTVIGEGDNLIKLSTNNGRIKVTK